MRGADESARHALAAAGGTGDRFTPTKTAHALVGVGYSLLAIAEAATRIADAFDAANEIRKNDPRRYQRGPSL